MTSRKRFRQFPSQESSSRFTLFGCCRSLMLMALLAVGLAAGCSKTATDDAPTANTTTPAAGEVVDGS